jgi:hypothetical protein
MNLPQKKYYLFGSLLSELLEEESSMRLGCESTLNHPFFDSISLNDVLLGHASHASQANLSPVPSRITSDFLLLGKTTPIATSAVESDLN